MTIAPLTCSNCTAPLDGAPEGDVLRCSYCGRSHRFVTPPPPPTTHRHPVGAPVLVEWNGRWWEAHVLEAQADRWHIRYDGWSSQWDETVGPERIRDRPSPHAPRVAAPTTVTRPARAGAGCWIAILATVLLLGLGAAIGMREAATIRSTTTEAPVGPPVTATTPLAPGQRVTIAWGGRWWPGSVVAVHADGRVRIHYDGYGDASDEDVTRDRLRLAVP